MGLAFFFLEKSDSVWPCRLPPHAAGLFQRCRQLRVADLLFPLFTIPLIPVSSANLIYSGFMLSSSFTDKNMKWRRSINNPEGPHETPPCIYHCTWICYQQRRGLDAARSGEHPGVETSPVAAIPQPGSSWQERPREQAPYFTLTAARRSHPG